MYTPPAYAESNLALMHAGAQALVIFQGPHAFISPSWYVNQLTFPTWNYTAIHAHGQPVLVENPEAIHDILRATVATFDTPVGGEWSFPAMPETMTQPRLRAIAGVRIPLDKLEGKMKLNQDKSVADRRRVIAALERQGGEQALAIAQMIREQADM